MIKKERGGGEEGKRKGGVLNGYLGGRGGREKGGKGKEGKEGGERKGRRRGGTYVNGFI